MSSCMDPIAKVTVFSPTMLCNQIDGVFFYYSKSCCQGNWTMFGLIMLCNHKIFRFRTKCHKTVSFCFSLCYRTGSLWIYELKRKHKHKHKKSIQNQCIMVIVLNRISTFVFMFPFMFVIRKLLIICTMPLWAMRSHFVTDWLKAVAPRA